MTQETNKPKLTKEEIYESWNKTGLLDNVQKEEDKRKLSLEFEEMGQTFIDKELELKESIPLYAAIIKLYLLGIKVKDKENFIKIWQSLSNDTTDDTEKFNKFIQLNILQDYLEKERQ